MPSLALILAAAIATQADAAPFAPAGGGFRVRMPAPPAERTRRVVAANGPIDVHYYMTIVGDVTFIASYSDRAADLAKGGPDPMLDGAVKGAVDGLDGAILARRPCRLGEAPGRDVRFSFAGPDGQPGLGRARIYLAGARMFSLTVVGPESEVVKEGDAFLDSFRLDAAVSAPSTTPAPAPAPPATADRPFVSAAGRFRVAMPGPTKEERRQYRTAGGPVDCHYFVAVRGGLVFLASYSDLPAPSSSSRDPAGAVLDGVIGGTVGPKGKLVAQRDAPLGPVPGRAFESTRTGADGRAVLSRSRAYAVGRRAYQVMVSGPERDVRSRAADDFLGSFALDAPAE